MYEVRRQAVQQLRLTDSSDSLEMRLACTKEMQSAERRWRARLLQLLEKGWLGCLCRFLWIGFFSSLVVDLRRSLIGMLQAYVFV